MSGRAAALSPLSPDTTSEWSGISKYGPGRKSDLASAGMMNMNARAEGLAPPSVASGANGVQRDRLSAGAAGRKPGEALNGPAPAMGAPRASVPHGFSSVDEEALYQHYIALKRFLTNLLRDERGKPRSDRAKDKLLRLSPVQFLELSTDVYDELLRRQSASGARRSGPGGSVQEGAPPFLMPEENFHPKRNQARQKLSTLQTMRFRDLATDVFYELERRFPPWVGTDDDDASRPGSSSRSVDGTGNVPAHLKGGPPSGARGPAPRLSDTSSPGGAYGDGNPYGAPAGEFGRPLPKTFHSNTIIPNKSTMVEEDDDTIGPDDSFEPSDPYGFGRRRSKRPTERGMDRPHANGVPHIHVQDTQEQAVELETRLRQQDDELVRLRATEGNHTDAVIRKTEEWSAIRSELEKQLSQARELNDTMRVQLERLQAVNTSQERELHYSRQQANGNAKEDDGELRQQYEDLQRRYDEMRRELNDQQQVTEEVRREASNFLAEMKSLAEQCGQSWEKEEALLHSVGRLEQEVDMWKTRCARSTGQLRGLRSSSSIGPQVALPNAGRYAHADFISASGRIKDVHVTQFQLAIDELVQAVHGDPPSPAVLTPMRAVVVCARHITRDVGSVPASGDSSGSSELGEQLKRLKTRLSSCANNLMATCKSYARSDGLSPVSLVDAAAASLAAAVVDIIQTAKVRATAVGETDDEEDEEDEATDRASSAIANGRFSPESVYSSTTARTAKPRREPVPSRDWHSAAQGSSSSGSNGVPLDHSHGNNDSNSNSNHRNQHDPSRNQVVSFGYGPPTRHDDADVDVDELKLYLEEQVDELVQAIQALVSSIRSNAGMSFIRGYVHDIASIVANVVNCTGTAIEEAREPSLRAALRDRGQPVIGKLTECQALLLNANLLDGERAISHPALLKEFTNQLPPLAFAIARETKQLIQRLDQVHPPHRRDRDPAAAAPRDLDREEHAGFR
ncbi:MAG: component of the polarisome [Phylliscum demangeonii]|nr:MAG: component of the polarisome [Phylliscum demangeonii]